MAELVDWDLAARTGARLVPSGPPVSPALAAETVRLLRHAALTAPAHVAAVTQLEVEPGSPAEVIERKQWVRANTESFKVLLDPVLERAAASRKAHAAARSRRPAGGDTHERPLPGSGLARAVTGTQVGALLALLAPRVLGQYDAFAGPNGRLLLVAPNVLAVSRELGVDLADFALWVTLHEQTHRVQFAAAPWLADHLAERARELSGDLLGEPGETSDRLLRVVRSLVSAARAATRPGTAPAGPDEANSDSVEGLGLISLVVTPEQRRAVADVTAVMSLLEGHADVAMDAVGPTVVPSVATIREKFSARRRSPSGLVDQLVRHGLGLEAKLRQYSQGAAFVRAVTAEVGTAGLNAVWTGPQALPTFAEIVDPAAWVARVHHR